MRSLAWSALDSNRWVQLFEQVGTHGSGSPNDNTASLLKFCSVTDTSVVGSWFCRRDIWRWTWISNDGDTKKEIDHILTRNRKNFFSYKVYRGAECPDNTDHNLIEAGFRINLVPARPRAESLQSQYAAGVRDALNNLRDLPDDIERAGILSEMRL